MPKYIVSKTALAAPKCWWDDNEWRDNSASAKTIIVLETESATVDTGVITSDGNAILRVVKESIGFLRAND